MLIYRTTIQLRIGADKGNLALYTMLVLLVFERKSLVMRVSDSKQSINTSCKIKALRVHAELQAQRRPSSAPSFGRPSDRLNNTGVSRGLMLLARERDIAIISFVYRLLFIRMLSSQNKEYTNKNTYVSCVIRQSDLSSVPTVQQLLVFFCLGHPPSVRGMVQY